MSLTTPLIGPADIATTTDATSFTTASWTPTANVTYFVAVVHGSAGSITAASISGNGMTWDAITNGTTTNGAGTRRIDCFCSFSGSAPTNGVTTINFGASQSQTGCIVFIYKMPGAANTGNGADAFRNGSNVVTAAAGSGTGVSISMGTYLDSTSGYVAITLQLANNAITPDATSGTVEVSEASFASPTVEGQFQFNAGNDATITNSWTGSSAWIALAIEVVALTSKSDSDSGTCTDSGGIGVSNSESGTVTEGTGIKVSDSDSGTNTSTESLGATNKADSDSGNGSETEVLTVAKTSSETFNTSGTFDGFYNTLDVTASFNQVIFGTDAHSVDTGARFVSDIMFPLTETNALSANFSSSDTATDVEVTSIKVTNTDSGTLTEATVVRIPVSSTDSGLLVESISLNATSFDVGVLIDFQSVFHNIRLPFYTLTRLLNVSTTFVGALVSSGEVDAVLVDPMTTLGFLTHSGTYVGERPNG